MIYYSLKIVIDDSEQIIQLTTILNVQPTDNDRVWKLTLNDSDSEVENEIIYLVDLVSEKIDEVTSIGISKEDITIWMEYEFDQQCNMEFFPNQLKKLGDLGIKLCISCWQKDGYIYFD